MIKISLALTYDYVLEEVEVLVLYKEVSVEDVIDSLIEWLRLGMRYCGAKKVTEMWKKAEFVRITSSGMKESKPHDVAVL